MRGGVILPLTPSGGRSAAAAPRTASRGTGRAFPRLLAPALGFGVSVLVAISAAGLYEMRQHALDMAILGEVGLLDALSQDVVRDVETYDLSLQGVVKGLAEPGLSSLSARLQDSVLFDNAASADWLGPIVVLDGAGRVARSSGPIAPASEDDYRRVFEDLASHPGRDLYVGAPHAMRAAAEDGAVVMARPLRSEDGTVSGAVVGTLRASYFKRLMSAAGLGWHEVVTLARTDGTVLARQPEGVAGAGSALEPARLARSRASTFRSRSAADGIARIHSSVGLADLPLVLAVSVSEDDVLASWQAKAGLIAAVLGALCATAAALGFLLTRQANRTARVEDRLSDSEAQYRLLAENVHDLILRLDASLHPVYVSPSSRALLGFGPAELMERDMREIVHPDDLPRITALVEAALRTGSGATLTYRLRHRDGHLVWVEGRYSPVPEQGSVVIVVRDISERKAAEERLEALNAELKLAANSDGLTGLANRRRFDEALGEEWRRAGRSGAPVSLLLLDVDRFKAFNDHYGHVAGDACLRAVADVLRGWARRPGDVAARYGGEEFALLLPAVDESGAAEVAEGVRAGVEALGLGHEGNAACGSVVTISVGCATLGTAEGSDGPAALVASADARLYRAKQGGRNGVAAAPVPRPAGRSPAGGTAA